MLAVIIHRQHLDWTSRIARREVGDLVAPTDRTEGLAGTLASAVANECQILQWECRLLGHLVDSDTIKTAWWAVQKEPESAEHDDILRHDEKLHGRAMCDSFLGWTEILQCRCQPICVLMQLMKPIVMPALGQLGRDHAGGRHRKAVQFLHPRAGSRVPTSKETVSHSSVLSFRPKDLI